MKRLLLSISVASFVILSASLAMSETIDFLIKGVDDGVRTNKEQDFKEAVMDAKLQAIEKAGEKTSSIKSIDDFQAKFTTIENKAKTVLSPGFQIVDIGYLQDGAYVIVLSGALASVMEVIDTKELLQAKSFIDGGESAKARKIITNIINNSKDCDVIGEAMYCFVLWNLASDERSVVERLRIYCPDSKYVGRLEAVLDKRGAELGIGKMAARDGRFIASEKGIVLDTKTGLMWPVEDNGEEISWTDAKKYCEQYEGGGYTDWRMPTQDELSEIYDQTKKNRYDYHVTELIGITACCPRAAETRDLLGGVAAYFNFSSGLRGWNHQWGSFCNRALPVRGGK